MKKSLAVKQRELRATLSSLDGLDAVDLKTVALYVRRLRDDADLKKTRIMKAMLKPGHSVRIIKGGKLIATGVIDRVKTKKALVKNFKYLTDKTATPGATYDVPLTMIAAV
jgi:hypothetical protein